MRQNERLLHIEDMADTYLYVARKFNHSAIFIHSIKGASDSLLRIAEEIRRKTGTEYFLMCHGDATLSVPAGSEIMAFSCRMADEPDVIKDEQKRSVERAVNRAAEYACTGLLDGFALC